MSRAFTLASFLGAALLFTVQPLVAKMLLPILGGSPSVWNTCMVFFQAALLAGYLYAHLVRRLRPALQVALHAALLLVAALSLPIALAGRAGPPAASSPVPWVLVTLGWMCGAPFAVLAATSPLLQRWYAATREEGASDPYFLYAASNLGSFAGLVAYPLVLERLLPLEGGLSQSTTWAATFGLFAPLIVAAGAAAARTAARGAPPPPPEHRAGASRLLRWGALAFVPSSLLLGVTQYITTDIASVPLLWIVPLALYLLTFVAAFRRAGPPGLAVPGWILAAAVLTSAALALPGIDAPWPVEAAVHLTLFGSAALLCHARLARARPDPSQLTSFYLAVAAGGAAGGVFNALAAPLLFRDVFEYPLMVAVACLARAPKSLDARTRRSAALDIGLAAALLATTWGGRVLADRAGLEGAAASTVSAAIPLALAAFMSTRRTRFAVAALVVLLVPWAQVRDRGLVHRERSFFGVSRVGLYAGGEIPIGDDGGLSSLPIPFHVLIHGSTRHGSQALVASLRGNPTTYYARSGPIGQVFEAYAGRPILEEIAVVGLGAGTLAAYGAEGRRMTFFEIDPVVERIAADPAYFTYLRDCPGPARVVLGDGRLSLSREADGRYGLIVLDAFSSDAIPVHLLTREAVAMYVRKLRPGGLVAFHVTNGYLDLPQVVAAVASDLGLAARVEYDDRVDRRDRALGKDRSVWAVCARTAADLGPLAADARWLPLTGPGASAPRASALWTDRFSNLVALLRR